MSVTEFAARVRGHQRPVRSRDELVRDAHAAASRLSIASRSWATLDPSAAALEEASNTIEGLRRTVAELRAVTEGVPPSAA